MTSFTSPVTRPNAAAKPAPTLGGFLAVLLMVNLRQKLAPRTPADNADAAYTWGL